jgi:hypothetical protein
VRMLLCLVLEFMSLFVKSSLDSEACADSLAVLVQLLVPPWKSEIQG